MPSSQPSIDARRLGGGGVPAAPPDAVVPIRSTHQRDKGILCLRFRDGDGSCPVTNCPYAHVASAERARLPPNACTFFLQSRCLREPCAFFHGRLDAFEALRRGGAESYAPAEHMPVRDPLRPLSAAESMLRAVDLEAGVVAQGHADGSALLSPTPLPVQPHYHHQYHAHHHHHPVHVLHHHHHHHFLLHHHYHHHPHHHPHHVPSLPMVPVSPFLQQQSAAAHLVSNAFYTQPQRPPQAQLWPPMPAPSTQHGGFGLDMFQHLHHHHHRAQAPPPPPPGFSQPPVPADTGTTPPAMVQPQHTTPAPPSADRT